MHQSLLLRYHKVVPALIGCKCQAELCAVDANVVVPFNTYFENVIDTNNIGGHKATSKLPPISGQPLLGLKVQWLLDLKLPSLCRLVDQGDAKRLSV